MSVQPPAPRRSPPRSTAGARTRTLFFDTDAFTPYTSTRYDGEWLLHVVDEAYERATGRAWGHTTRYRYETFCNLDGWPRLRDGTA